MKSGASRNAEVRCARGCVSQGATATPGIGKWLINRPNTSMSQFTGPPKHKRRWYQFSLWTLLVVMTLFTVGVGWIGSRMHRARANRDRGASVEKEIEETAAKIEKLGGEVTSAYKQRRQQTWLEELFDDPGGPDDPVGGLTVERVDFSHVCTDAGLVHVGKLTNVERLSLYRSDITDSGLEHLKTLTHLEELNLDSTMVTDAGLEHLKGLRRLRELNLANTKVSDAGLEYLKGLTNLDFLDLTNTQVTNAGLEHLNRLTKLDFLDLSETRVTDEGLIHLKGLSNLRRLDLGGTQFTDEGLIHLAGLTNLRELHLLGTSVTDVGVKKLQQALPICRIEDYRQ